MAEITEHLTYARDVFHLLANERRLHILRVLHLSEDPLPAMEIAERIEASTSATSHHLIRLHEVGLLRVEKAGNRRLYGLSQQSLHRRLQILFPQVFPDPNGPAVRWTD